DERAHRRDRFVHGTEMHRNVGGLSDHFTGGVEQRRRTVATLANVRGYRRVNQNEAHLLRDGRERVSHHLEPDGVEGHVRSTNTAPHGCTVPRHSGSLRAAASRPAKIEPEWRGTVHPCGAVLVERDRKSTRLNSSHT